MTANSVDIVIQEVASATGVRPWEMKRGGRNFRVSSARNAAYYLARQLTGLSFPQLGRGFSRDHTTVMSGHDRCRKMMLADPDYRHMVRQLAEKCREELNKAKPVGRPDIKPDPGIIPEPVKTSPRPQPIAPKPPERPKPLKPRKCCVTECGKIFHPESRFIRRCPNCRKQDGGMFEGYAL